jgi:hypothetical protein
MKRLIITLLIILSPCLAGAATYYVDCNANGDAGAGTGTGAAVAWKTINKVNTSSFSAGDSVLFNKGCTWLETLTVPSSGSVGSVITFSSYGTGVKPIISGDVDSSGTHSVGDNDYGIDTNGKQYLTFSDIKCTLQNKAGIRYRNSQNLIFDGVDVSYAYEQGTCDDGTGGAPYQNENITIKNGEFSYCGGAGINFGSAELIGTIYIQSNNVHNNCTLDVAGVGAHDSASGIKLYGAGTATVYIESNLIHDNGVAGHTGESGGGVWLDTLAAGEATVRYNRIYNNGGSGVLVEACSSQKVHYNVIYGNGALLQAASAPRGWYSGIGIYGGNTNAIYNNTLSGNYWGLSSENGVLAGTGNIFKNNMVDNSTAYEFFYAHASGVGNIDVTETYNAFGEAKVGLSQINFVDKDTYAALATALGYTTYNVTTDPGFISVVGTDFRLAATIAGTSVSLTRDYGGYSVSGTPDMGAWEYGAPTRQALGGTAGGVSQ